MAPQIWNPDRALNIGAFDNDNGMFCVGEAVSHGGARCRWRITGDRYRRVCSILDVMGTKPPTEIFSSKLISQLAKLSLCEEQHQPQKQHILYRWDDMIEDVATKYEEMEELKRRNRQCKIKLVKEREERERHYLVELDSQMASIRVTLAQHEKSKKRESDLLLQVGEVEHSFAESRGQVEHLTVQKDGLSRELVEERCISAQLQQDREVLAKQVDELQSQLSIIHQTSEALRRDLEKVTTDRKCLLAQTESLRTRSANTSQSLNQVKRNLDEAETTQACLLKEKYDLQSLLAARFQTSSQLEKKLETLEAQLTSLRATLEDTQFDLLQSRKANEEQATANAASQLASTVGTAQLLARIRQLEEASQVSLLSSFLRMMTAVSKHIVPWATGRK